MDEIILKSFQHFFFFFCKHPMWPLIAPSPKHASPIHTLSTPLSCKSDLTQCSAFVCITPQEFQAKASTHKPAEGAPVIFRANEILSQHSSKLQMYLTTPSNKSAFIPVSVLIVKEHCCDRVRSALAFPPLDTPTQHSRGRPVMSLN